MQITLDKKDAKALVELNELFSQADSFFSCMSPEGRDMCLDAFSGEFSLNHVIQSGLKASEELIDSARLFPRNARSIEIEDIGDNRALEKVRDIFQKAYYVFSGMTQESMGKMYRAHEPNNSLNHAVLWGREASEELVNVVHRKFIHESLKNDLALKEIPKGELLKNGWLEADGRTKDIMPGAAFMRSIGGGGTPFAQYDFTIIESDAGKWIPVHGSVKMPSVESPEDAAYGLMSYWHAEDKFRYDVGNEVREYFAKEKVAMGEYKHIPQLDGRRKMKKTDAERLNDYVVAFEVGRLVSRGAINDGTFDGQRLSASKHALSTPNEDVVSECLRWWDDAIKSGLLVERNLDALDVLRAYPGGKLVSDFYDNDQEFADAINGVFGDSFEYPDFSHRTVERVVKMGEKEVAKSLPAAHELTFSEFSKFATAVKLENHGREWEVFYGKDSMGFADGPSVSEALKMAHIGAVNNAIYANSPDAPDFMKDTQVFPPENVVAEYPHLKERFADVFAARNGAAVALQSVQQQSNSLAPFLHVGQRFDFKQGDDVVANGFRGSVVKVLDGQLAGMVEVRLPGGVVCNSASFPDCFPAVTNGVEVVTDGRFIGAVKEVSGQFVVQDAGRGRLVAHECHRFENLPAVGDSIDLQHRGGKVVFSVEKDKGRGNER